jgi:hypothetical protein
MPNVKLKPLMDRIDHWRGRASTGRGVSGRRWGVLLLCLASVLPGSLRAATPAIGFSAARVEYGDMRFEQVRADLASSGQFRLEVKSMSGPGEEFLGEGLVLTGMLESSPPAGEEPRWRSTVAARGLEAVVTVHDSPEDFRLELSALKQPLQRLADWPGLPAELGWLSGGLFDARLTLRQPARQLPALDFQLDVEQLDFDSPAGQYAGAALQIGIAGAWPDLGAESATVRGSLRSGELLIADFYRDFSEAALDFSADVRWNDALLQIDNLSLGDDGALAADARIRMGLGSDGAAWSAELSRLELDFPLAYRRYIEPLGAAWTLNGLEVTGRVLWSGQWDSGSLVSGDLEISDFSVVDTLRQRFALTGLAARLRPGDHAFDSRLAWRGLLLGKVNLGAGQAALDSEPGSIALREPLALDVLGGRVELGVLKVILPGSRADGAGEPDVRLRARIDDLDMGQLTAALEWPAFGGTISGEVPGVSFDDGVLGVDGEIRFDVFGGRIAVQNLSIERAFGVLPGLAADVQVTDLDLEQLTQTFSFGRIAGRLDGHVQALRMLDWEPVAFDGWLGTPERQSGSNDISRQAVNRLTTIGGGNATAALTGPLMRMFNSFSYRRLGLGCRLHNNVCELRGLKEDAGSVVLLEGAGVPKITIRAFNRNIDWPQMVSNLVAISGDASVTIGAQPESR